MIVLNTSSQKLEAILAAGVSATPLDITVVYYDTLPQRLDTLQWQRYGSQEATLSSATVTTIADAPGEGIVRSITNIFSFNRDSGNVVLSIKKNRGTASTFYKQQTLTPGQTLTYEHGDGWEVL
jgi:hypothetical protein